MIIVVSHPDDDHATGVLAALATRRHPVALVDTGLFPARSRLTQRFGDGPPRFEIVLEDVALDLAPARVGWWRRPRPFTLHDGIAPDVAAFTYTECHEAIAGLWAALDLSWVNPPALDEVAHHKPYQLAVATEVGLPIPRTVITNDPDEAAAFSAANGPGRTIYKTFLATEEHWRETRLLRDDELALLDRVRLAPVIFQEFVPAVADIRVTVLGDRLFATAVTTAPGSYAYDYRMDLGGATFSPTELAPEMEAKLLALMRRLGIVYGAIDLRRTPDGGDVFLEVNPAGEWRFIEDRTGQPITEAMADLLIALDKER
jgi:glutathione synthase/RimK-type ligase-like ATP-grasp enzyme